MTKSLVLSDGLNFFDEGFGLKLKQEIQKVKIEQMTKIFLTDFVENAISNFIKKDLKIKFYNKLLNNIPKTEIINFEYISFYALNNMYGFKLESKKSKKKNGFIGEYDLYFLSNYMGNLQLHLENERLHPTLNFKKVKYNIFNEK